MSLPIVVVIGIAAGGATLLAAAVALAFWCAARLRARRRNRSSDTGSSNPSTEVEWGKGARISSASPEYQGTRQFSLEELVQATENFSEANVVGAGNFGLVYMRLLLDGTVVAIKRRVAAPMQEFAGEVSRIQRSLTETL